MGEKYQNLYHYPRLLYKYFPLSEEYATATEYTNGNQLNYLFTPNIPREKMEKEPSNKVVDKWRLIVFDGLLFYSSPTFLNDPFDSMLPSVPKIVPPLNERQDIIAELKKIHRIKRKDEDRLLICDDFDNSLSIVFNKLGFPEELQNQLFKEIKLRGKKYKEEIAISCFSEINNSKLMWSHYANSYSGFCIEYDFAKTLDIDFKKGIGKVIYSDKKPNEHDFDNNSEYTNAILLTKASCWKYEREWRSINIMPYKLYSNKIYSIVNVKNCITAIYLGCNMPEHYQMEIAQYYRHSNVKVYKMQLNEREFDFDFELIN